MTIPEEIFGAGPDFRETEERLRLAESVIGIGTFEMDISSGALSWGPQLALLLGLDESAEQSFASWERVILVDDVPKIRAALEVAATEGSCQVEFRVRVASGGIRWISCKGQRASNVAVRVRGACFEITERKALEARLLAMNETLEARVAQVRHEAHALQVLNSTGVAVAAEHDLERLVQMVTDAGVELSYAQFGAFFYNVKDGSDESYTLYTLSGAPREAFSRFPMPRNTAIFEPTFRGRGPVRSGDILADPRYGRNAPYKGMPEGHLPVRSYLAVPVVARSGEVLGGLFLGHAQPHVFTERAERIVCALASQAAVAIDNARLHQTSQSEIAARRQAELDLQRLNQTLEERAEERARQLATSLTKLEDTERRFSLLVESVSDYAIYMLDPAGLVVNWNSGAEKIKGYARDEIVGSHFSGFYTTEDQQAGIPQKAITQAAKIGKYEAEGWRVRKDGSRFWAGVVINAIRSADGELVGFAKVTRDLTERRAADERARQTQKMEGIGQLTGGVAHDFNNLLTIILGNLETLQRNLGKAELNIDHLRRSADHAMRGARRAEALTQRLLAFSRQQPLEPKSVDLGRLVVGMSDLLRRTLGEQISVQTVLEGSTWRAHVDPNQLELAILNLAVNARDAMPNGGNLTIETGNVHLDEKYASEQAEVVPGQYVVVAVSDTGHGMTPEVRSKAFDPFFTTKDVGHGTGLGLSQVYGFAKQSRGHVKIYSEVGEGTTIKLYLPRVHGPTELSEAQSLEVAVRGSRTETILVVEDDPDVRAFSCETLRELGYNVLEAENGRAGLKVLDANPSIRVLFTDVGLPGGINGRQLADEARRRRRELKVLFTTGYARNAIVHDGRLDPGVELITKPFTQAALAGKLRNIIDSGRLPGRVLLVADEAAIRGVTTRYLEEAGYKVDTAGSATEAMSKLALVPGGVDAAIVDVSLPDVRRDLIREMRAVYPSLPIVMTGAHDAEQVRQASGAQGAAIVLAKPYAARDLLTALQGLGLRCA